MSGSTFWNWTPSCLCPHFSSCFLPRPPFQLLECVILAFCGRGALVHVFLLPGTPALTSTDPYLGLSFKVHFFRRWGSWSPSSPFGPPDHSASLYGTHHTRPGCPPTRRQAREGRTVSFPVLPQRQAQSKCAVGPQCLWMARVGHRGPRKSMLRTTDVCLF